MPWLPQYCTESYRREKREACPAVREHDVDEAEEREAEDGAERERELLPARAGLQEGHLGAVPDGGQVLLAVRMRHELHSHDVEYVC